MKEITVNLLKSVGNIRFGMKRSEVRENLGQYKEFKKSQFSKNTTDDFGICHVYYDREDKCEAVELFDGVDIKILNTINLPKKFDEICTVLKSLDGNLEVAEDYCTSIKYSIGVYAIGNKVDTILFGKSGYYDI